TSAHRFRWPKPPTSTARTRDCLTIRLPPSRQAAPGAPSKRARRWSARVRALVAHDPVLSDLILRAYLMRRSLLIQEGTGFRIIGSCYDPDTARLREFAARNRLPHRWIDLERDKHAERLLQRFGVSPQDTPVVIWGGEVLRNPTNTELARRVGLPVPDTVPDESDVVV